MRSALSDSRLAKDTAMATVGQVLRLLLQAAYFILIGRTFVPAEFGAFVAMTAMVALVATFAGLGWSNILVKNVTRDRDLLPMYWGNGLLITLVTGLLLTGVIWAAGTIVFPANLWRSLLLICVSDLLCCRVAELASFGFLAVGNMAESALINVSISLCRLIALAVLAFTLTQPHIEAWAVAYLAASFVTFAYSFIRLSLVAGRFRFDVPRIRGEVVEGTYFALSVSVSAIYNDVDKTMLARLSDMTSTGIYAAAYRLVDVAMAPIRSFAAACYAEFFRRGQGGARATLPYARKQIKRAIIYGVAVVGGLIVGAPLLPILMGDAYQRSVEAIRWLAIIPLLRCIHVFLADALAGAGYMRPRIAVQLSVAVLNVALNVPFILRWSWRGAVWTSVLCDSLLVLGMWAAARWVAHNETSPNRKGVE